MFSIIVLVCRAIGRMIREFSEKEADRSDISSLSYAMEGMV